MQVIEGRTYDFGVNFVNLEAEGVDQTISIHNNVDDSVVATITSGITSIGSDISPTLSWTPDFTGKVYFVCSDNRSGMTGDLPTPKSYFDKITLKDTTVRGERQVELLLSKEDVSNTDMSFVQYFSKYLAPLGTSFTTTRV